MLYEHAFIGVNLQYLGYWTKQPVKISSIEN